MFTNIILITVCYLLGCLNTGYYYTKIFYKKDIREIGTNVTGALNVSRLAGKRGFIVTFFGDALKGALVVLLCRLVKAADWVSLTAILMVLLGHVFPFQLKFKGGKGMSTIFGALLVYNPILILMLFGTCLIIFPFVRRYTVTSLFALLIFPLEVFFADFSFRMIYFSLAYAIVIIYACKDNVREYIMTKAYEGNYPSKEKREKSSDIADKEKE